jgi:hypothetical protein
VSSKKDKKDKKDKKKKPDKKKAEAKKAASVLDGRVCPCCKKHCPLAKPKCSKGKAVRAKALKDA